MLPVKRRNSYKLLEPMETNRLSSRAALSHGLNKFKRYRIGKRAKRMKLLRLGVPDPTAPGFTEEARRQAALLRGVPDETEALDFIEAVADTAKCTLTPFSVLL